MSGYIDLDICHFLGVLYLVVQMDIKGKLEQVLERKGSEDQHERLEI